MEPSYSEKLIIKIDVRAIVNALLYKNGACFRRMFR
jgi:hypothetical protein